MFIKLYITKLCLNLVTQQKGGKRQAFGAPRNEGKVNILICSVAFSTIIYISRAIYHDSFIIIIVLSVTKHGDIGTAALNTIGLATPYRF